MSLLQSYETKILTYLADAHIVKSIEKVPENDIIVHLTSWNSIEEIEKKEIQDDHLIPTENRVRYVDEMNKHSSRIQMLLDHLVEVDRYIKRYHENYEVYYQMNEENSFIQKFMNLHRQGLKYVSHRAFSAKRKLDEMTLCEGFHDIHIEPLSKINISKPNIEMKIEKRVEEDPWRILSIWTLQSLTDENVYYNVYYHANHMMTCVCPYFKHQCINKNKEIVGECKHISCYSKSEYHGYVDIEGYKIDLDGNIYLKGDNLEKYKEEVTDVMFDGTKDIEHITSETIFCGWIDYDSDSEMSEMDSI